MLLRPNHVSYLALRTQRVKFGPPNLEISGARKGDPPTTSFTKKCPTTLAAPDMNAKFLINCDKACKATFPNASLFFLSQRVIMHDPPNLEISGPGGRGGEAMARISCPDMKQPFAISTSARSRSGTKSSFNLVKIWLAIWWQIWSWSCTRPGKTSGTRFGMASGTRSTFSLVRLAGPTTRRNSRLNKHPID